MKLKITFNHIDMECTVDWNTHWGKYGERWELHQLQNPMEWLRELEYWIHERMHNSIEHDTHDKNGVFLCRACELGEEYLKRKWTSYEKDCLCAHEYAYRNASLYGLKLTIKDWRIIQVDSLPNKYDR